MGTEAINTLQRVDVVDNTLVNYVETTTWIDGSPITLAKCDGYVYKQHQNGKFYRKAIDSKDYLKIDSISNLRNLSGFYEGHTIQLVGYYAAGDKPPVDYKFTTLNFGSLVDDGGAVIKTTKGSWIAQFNKDSVDVRDYGIKTGDVNSTPIWTKLNTYCVANNKYIDLSIDVTLVFSSNTNIFTANIRGRGVTLTLDGLVWFRTDNLTSVDISGFNVYVKNNYTTLVSTNGSTNIFYNPSAVYNANRTVSYQNLTCIAEAPLYDGSNRLSGFIRDGGYDKGTYRNIVTTNVSNPIITNSSASSKNHLIENITVYNFGTGVWAQGENQKVRNVKAYNTPIQATNWTNKNNPTTPRDVNGFDAVLASGNGLEISEIYTENPIERVVYVQCNDVKAYNIYSLNGDGVKFVGQGYSSICKNIYINNVKMDFDSNFALTFNVTCLQIYWVDNWEINNVTINNKNTTADILLNLYSFKRNAKNVRINNVTMVGDRGVTGPLGEFTIHDVDTAGTIPYQNIEINNVKGIKSRGRSSATFNHYYNSNPSETLISNLKITNCYINYQKISEQGDDALYRFDRIDGFEARGNSSNVRGHWVGGFPNPMPSGAYSNILIQEDNLKAVNIEANISAMSQGLTLLAGSYLNFEIASGNNLKAVFKGSGLSYFDWRVSNGVNNTVTATGRTFFVETTTKANGYTSCNVIANVKTAIVGTVPTTLVNYSDGAASLSVRGDTFNNPYEFKAKIYI